MKSRAGLFPKVILYLRQVQELTLFVIMSNKRWFLAFGSSPLYFIMLPFIGILITILTVLNGIDFARSSNKNLDKLLGFCTAILSTIFASVSLYGSVIAKLIGVLFPIGPWFFFSSMLVAGVEQLFMLGVNVYRVNEARPNTSQRMHFMQAAFRNTFVLGLLLVSMATVYTLLLFPVASQIGTAYAIAAVTFAAINIAWQIIPRPWKLTFKSLLHLSKPKEDIDVPSFPSLVSKNESRVYNHRRLFSSNNYSAEIRAMDEKNSEHYLIGLINRKIAYLLDHADTKHQKTCDKLALLRVLLVAISTHELICKKSIQKEYPLVFQSFFCEKGEVESLFDATVVYLEKVSYACSDRALEKSI